MTAPQSHAPPSTWHELLAQAVRTPGLVHEAYERFHRYSMYNRLLAAAQCLERGIPPGPLRTFVGWQELGRAVRRGEKGLLLCTPITVRNEDDEQVPVGFIYRARWFMLSQTDGAPYEEVDTPTWSEERALSNLGIQRVPFAHLDGNVQGYSTVQNEIAISPIAALPHKTLFHELAHLLLDHVANGWHPTRDGATVSSNSGTWNSILFSGLPISTRIPVRLTYSGAHGGCAGRYARFGSIYATMGRPTSVVRWPGGYRLACRWTKAGDITRGVGRFVRSGERPTCCSAAD